MELRPRPEQRATRKRPTVESPRKSVAPRAVEVLTDQDAQIAELAGQGWPNRRIAAELDIPPRTVATRLYQVFFRLGVTTRSQLTTAMLGDGR
ncbi:response regulator transcription factor [Streptomyces tendae]